MSDTTQHPTHLKVGPFTLVSAAAAKGLYHCHLWAVPGGKIMHTTELYDLAALRGWGVPYQVNLEPISQAKVSARVGVPDVEIGRINRGPTHREVWPGNTGAR